MADIASSAYSPPRAARPAWSVVADRELRDMWVAGRGLPLMLAYTLLLSVTSYLAATDKELNFLDQREAVGVTLQVAVAIGGLLVLLAAADAVSGERERDTLEGLLLTPAPRRALILGKGLAALSLWVAAFVVSVPYIWYLGRGVDVVMGAVAGGVVVGSILAVFLAGLGLVISMVSRSNRISLSASLFVLLALFTPTQMPSSAQNAWVGEVLLRVDPFTAGLRYLGKLVIDGHSPGQDISLMAGPAVAALLSVAAAWVVAGRLALQPGGRS